MMAKFCPECGNQLRDGIKFCDKCGAQIQAPQTNQNAPSIDSATNYVMYKANEKSMSVAMLISFFFTGLGIVYAGNTEKGIIFFVVAWLLNIILLFTYGGALFFISIIVWIVGLILTYMEVEKVNNTNKMRYVYNQTKR